MEVMVLDVAKVMEVELLEVEASVAKPLVVMVVDLEVSVAKVLVVASMVAGVLLAEVSLEVVLGDLVEVMMVAEASMESRSKPPEATSHPNPSKQRSGNR